MESGKLIVWLLTNMRCETGNCTSVACFQLGKRVQITLGRRVIVLLKASQTYLKISGLAYLS